MRLLRIHYTCIHGLGPTKHDHRLVNDSTTQVHSNFLTLVPESVDFETPVTFGVSG